MGIWCYNGRVSVTEISDSILATANNDFMHLSFFYRWQKNNFMKVWNARYPQNFGALINFDLNLT